MCLNKLANGLRKWFQVRNMRNRPIRDHSDRDVAGFRAEYSGGVSHHIQHSVNHAESFYLKRYDGGPSEPTPWRPMKAYEVALRGDIETLHRAVTECNGEVYTYGDSSGRVMMVVPADISLAHIQGVLEITGSDATFLHVTELGTP